MSTLGRSPNAIFSLEQNIYILGCNPMITMVIKLSGVLACTTDGKNTVVIGALNRYKCRTSSLSYKYSQTFSNDHTQNTPIVSR